MDLMDPAPYGPRILWTPHLVKLKRVPHFESFLTLTDRNIRFFRA